MSPVQAFLFTPDGLTLVAVLDQVRGITWQDELSKPGTASFEIPLDDPKTVLVVDRSIVKFHHLNAIRFGCVITTETCTVNTAGGRTWLKFDTQPGVSAILGRSVVMPEYGLTRKSSDSRLFGFMSKKGILSAGWFVDADWSVPVGYRWDEDTTIRAGYPPVFDSVDRGAQWIAPDPGPAVTQPKGTVAYYRQTFPVTSEIPVTIYVAADAYLTLYLDGEVVISPDYTTTLPWTTAQTVVTTLGEGEHILAARVENATTGGPLGFIASVVYLSDTGQAGEAVQSEILPGDVLFDFGSSTLDADARAAVDATTDRMTGDTPTVTVVGHTDSVGSAAFNMALSIQRAQAVADRITDQKPGAIVTIVGRGETEPIATNETDAGRAQNRRVVITYSHAVEPTTTPGETQTATVVQHTNALWEVHTATPSPGWFRASVLRRLVLEGQNRNVAGYNGLTIDYDDTLDSSGRAWTHRGEYAFPVATVSVLDVAQQLAEAEMDWGMDPDTMTVQAWVRRGEDRSSGTETVALWTGASLKAYSTTRAGARLTAIVAHMSDGAWQETTDPKGTAIVGRVEVGLNLGSALAPATAKAVALGLLSESAHPAVTITGETSTLVGPQPYTDYGVGDTLSVPGHRGVGRMKARVMSISVDATGDIVRAWPELVMDRSASVGIGGPDGSVWSLYADTGGQLTVDLSPPGSQATVISFRDGATSYTLTVGDAETLVLTTMATNTGTYTPGVPLVVPTADPGVLLDVWVTDGQLLAEERNT